MLILVHFVFHDKICDDCKTCPQVSQLHLLFESLLTLLNKKIFLLKLNYFLALLDITWKVNICLPYILMFTVILVLDISQERDTILTFCIFAFIRLDGASTKFCTLRFILWNHAHVVGLPWLWTVTLYQMNNCIRSRKQRCHYWFEFAIN